MYTNSPWKGEIYVPIDLGSIPETLFESELFGFEKGAFTDAQKKKPGRLEVASGGTLFLNEIGNLSLPLQAKLLSVIEQRKKFATGFHHFLSGRRETDMRNEYRPVYSHRQRAVPARSSLPHQYDRNTYPLPLHERGNDLFPACRSLFTTLSEKI